MNSEETAAGLMTILARAEMLGVQVDELLAIDAAAEQVREACQAAARRTLSAQRDSLVLAAIETGEALTEAQSAMEPGAAELARLQHELAEVRARISAGAAVTDDDPLDSRLMADAQRLALSNQETRLTARIAAVQDRQSPLIAEAGAARRTAEIAVAAVDELDAAIANPLSSTEGLRSKPGQLWLLQSGSWLAAVDERGVLGDASRAFLHSVMAATGYGERTERNVLDFMERQAQRKAGQLVAGDGSTALASVPGIVDVSRIPVAEQLGSASLESMAAHSRTQFERSGGLHQATVQPMNPQPARDVSGTPSDFR